MDEVCHLSQVGRNDGAGLLPGRLALYLVHDSGFGDLSDCYSAIEK
jgi:hypothetical protein